MNPYSKAAVESRAAIQREAVARRDRLAREAKHDASPAALYALERAEIDVCAGLTRMDAMGDPLPGDAPAPTVPLSATTAPISSPPSPFAHTPPAATGLPIEPKPDPIEAVVARIMKA
jgi:hypothetical protein